MSEGMSDKILNWGRRGEWGCQTVGVSRVYRWDVKLGMSDRGMPDQGILD